MKLPIKLDPQTKKEAEYIVQSIEHVTGCHRNIWLKQKSRATPYSTYRTIMSYIIYNNLKITLTLTGNLMGKDHATIIHSISNVNEWKSVPKMYESELRLLDSVMMEYNSRSNIDTFIDSHGNIWRKQTNEKSIENKQDYIRAEGML